MTDADIKSNAVELWKEGRELGKAGHAKRAIELFRQALGQFHDRGLGAAVGAHGRLPGEGAQRTDVDNTASTVFADHR